MSLSHAGSTDKRSESSFGDTPWEVTDAQVDGNRRDERERGHRYGHARRGRHCRRRPLPGKGRREEGDAETDQEVEDAAERERAARNSVNPDAHRDEEPFNS